jgi:hypothetical protein
MRVLDSIRMVKACLRDFSRLHLTPGSYRGLRFEYIIIYAHVLSHIGEMGGAGISAV